MARTSYSYEKFQREKRKAEKRKQRMESKQARSAEKAGKTNPGAPGEPEDTAAADDAPASDEESPRPPAEESSKDPSTGS